jgi:hypothetical protein
MLLQFLKKTFILLLFLKELEERLVVKVVTELNLIVYSRPEVKIN